MARIFGKIDLPKEYKDLHGIFPVIASSNIESESEVILCVQDEIDNTNELSSFMNTELTFSSGLIDTNYGGIIFMLFTLHDTARPDEKYVYEIVFDPAEKETLGQYEALAKQERLKIFILQNNKIVQVFDFENNFNIGEFLNSAIAASKDKPVTNFEEARRQYNEEYDIETLLNYQQDQQ